MFPSALWGFGVLFVLGVFASIPVPFWDKGRLCPLSLGRWQRRGGLAASAGECSAHAGRDWEHWEHCHGGVAAGSEGWLRDPGRRERGSTGWVQPR